MSHSTVLVVLDKDIDPTDGSAVRAALTEALDPFDENEAVEAYRIYQEDEILRSLAFDEGIEEAVVAAGGKPVPPSPDPADDEAEHKRRWKQHRADEVMWGADAVELLGTQRIIDLWSDADEPIGYDPKQGWYRVSTYNPQSKWDWWVLGGRWGGLLKAKNGAAGVVGDQPSYGSVQPLTGYFDALRLGDIANLDEITTFALLLDGEWTEQGHMGWWGIVSDGVEADEWRATFARHLHRTDPRRVVAVVDVHI